MDGDQARGYLQLYRTGIIEAVDAMLLSVGEGLNRGKVFSSIGFEVGLVRGVCRFLSVLESIGVNPPLALMVALTDIKDYTFVTDQSGLFSRGRFDREVLMPREVVIDAYAADVPMTLKPVLDQIWNAADSHGSPYFKDGRWIGEEVARQLGGIPF